MGKVDRAGRRRRHIRCGECSTRMMQALSRSPGGLERMITVIISACTAFGAYGLGGQDGDHVPVNKVCGEVPFIVTATGQMYKRSKLSGAIG